MLALALYVLVKKLFAVKLAPKDFLEVVSFPVRVSAKELKAIVVLPDSFVGSTGDVFGMTKAAPRPNWPTSGPERGGQR